MARRSRVTDEPMTERTDGHPCPAAGCGEVVPFGMFACAPHWFSLPKELRIRIGGTWRRRDMKSWVAAAREGRELLGAVDA